MEGRHYLRCLGQPALFTPNGDLIRFRTKKHLALLRTESALDARKVDPLVTMESEARADAVRRALEMLGEREREVLLLRDAGLGYSEIAERTGLAVGAVGTTLCRARKRLVEAHASLEETHAARG